MMSFFFIFFFIFVKSSEVLVKPRVSCLIRHSFILK